jgi:8-oxo-dGTP diphosphatase
MEPVLTLTDEDIGIQSEPVDEWRERRAVRCILMRGDKIALLHVRKDHYHKLPGGGIEGEENIEDALRREVVEETGSQILIGELLGVIIEYRSKFKELQPSTCYFATEQSAGTPTYTQEEQDHGFALEWYSLRDALALLGRETPTSYVGKFIVKRDSAFLQEATKRQS